MNSVRAARIPGPTTTGRSAYRSISRSLSADPRRRVGQVHRLTLAVALAVPDPTLGLVLLLGGAVLVGAVVQGSVGFGIVVVAAPFVIWAAPELMPGSMLVCGFVMPLMHLSTGWRDVDRASLRSALAGRLLLTPVGVWVVAVSSPRLIALLVGILVLVVAVASAYAPEFEARPRNLFVAGLLTGISGTSAAVGGPFVAMTLQHEDPATIRATLAAFFTVGSAASMTGLALAGRADAHPAAVGRDLRAVPAGGLPAGRAGRAAARRQPAARGDARLLRGVRDLDHPQGGAG